tara:strand:+ start:371 stop:589 length:219 start_codon:yes stop_codon:yes gene_type:complete
MKTLNDLKQAITKLNVEDYQITQSAGMKDTFQFQITTKDVFTMPLGFNIRSFGAAGMSNFRCCISFVVRFED